MPVGCSMSTCTDNSRLLSVGFDRERPHCRFVGITCGGATDALPVAAWDISMARLATTLEGTRRTLRWAIVVLSATNGEAWAQFTQRISRGSSGSARRRSAPRARRSRTLDGFRDALTSRPADHVASSGLFPLPAANPNNSLAPPGGRARRLAAGWQRHRFPLPRGIARGDVSRLHGRPRRRRATPAYAAGHQRGCLRLLARREATRVHRA